MKQKEKKKEKKKFRFPIIHKFLNFSRKTKIICVITFFACVSLIFATYAWFSASLNVKVKFFNVKVATDMGLFISLDGVNYSDMIEISRDSIITNLKNTYPNHTNQWANNGLWSVSSNGIKTTNSSKFSVYDGLMDKYKDKPRRGQRYIHTYLMSEDKPSEYSQFISFDIFLKNVSGSPYKDNLYIGDGTYIEYDETADEETMGKMEDIMNSLRLGIVRIGETSSKSDVTTIQNLQCNNECKAIIYEPNSLLHNTESISMAEGLGIPLEDNTYVPTYGVIAEGRYLNHKSGFVNSGVALDTEHFALQNTIVESDFATPIFQVPNGVTKARVYLWIEGQDIDALEVHSEGAPIILSLDLEKDLAGYRDL